VLHLIKDSPHPRSNPMVRRIYIYDKESDRGLGQFWGSVCGKCFLEVPKDFLVKDKTKKHGYKSLCVPCQKNQNRRSYIRKRETILEKAEAYRNLNKDQIKNYQKKYRELSGGSASYHRRNKERTDDEIMAARERLRPHGNKVCSTCKEEQPLSEFHAQRIMPDGLRYSCRSCDKHRKIRNNYGECLDYWMEVGIPAECCIYCGGPFEHVDHLIARSKGGPNEVFNTVPSCARCNTSKNSHPLLGWYPRYAEVSGISQTIEELLSRLPETVRNMIYSS